MTEFTFDNSIPATNNNPSNDQMGMLTNNQSTQSIIDVDHITFGLENGGTHRQQQYSAAVAFTALPDGITGIAYPKNDTANTLNMYFGNTTNFIDGVPYTLPMSMIKAGGVAVLNQGSSSLTYNFNCVSIAYGGAGVYNITLTSGLVQGTHVLVSLSVNQSASPELSTLRWTYSSNILTIYGPTSGSLTVSFVVMQF